MKKNNLYKLLGIAFVVAIVSTGIFYGLFVSRMTSNSGTGKMLVVAAKALTPGTVLQPADVKIVPWPGEQIPKGAFEHVEDVTGDTVFDSINADEPVFASHLATARSGGGAGVPEGMRAVSVHVTDSTGVLSLLRPGQKVDVQVVVGRGEARGTVVRTALENLQIVSVHPQPEPSLQGTSLPVVTLLANPSEADVLAAADSGARVRLTLRNPLDDQTGKRNPLSLDAVMHARAGGSSKTGR